MTEVTIICEACSGNGFVRVPHGIYAGQSEVVQCDVCHSSGEVQPSREVKGHPAILGWQWKTDDRR